MRDATTQMSNALHAEPMIIFKHIYNLYGYWLQPARTHLYSFSFLNIFTTSLEKQTCIHAYLDAVSVHHLRRLAVDERHLGVVLHASPVVAGGRRVAVDVHHVHFGDVDETEHTQVEEEVHLAAADPHDVRDVRHQFVVRLLRRRYALVVVEDLAHRPAERRPQPPYVLREEPVRQREAERHLADGALRPQRRAGVVARLPPAVTPHLLHRVLAGEAALRQQERVGGAPRRRR